MVLDRLFAYFKLVGYLLVCIAIGHVAEDLALTLEALEAQSVDERVIELCRLWWSKADEDLKAAERLSDMAFVCCFHCQQTVEKSIKCLLVLNQVEFSKSHDIGMLLNLLTAVSRVPIFGA